MTRTFAFPVAVMVSLLGSIVVEPSYAAGMNTQTYSPDYDKCMDKSGGVTAEMLDCASAELSLQDKKLNAAYQTLMRKSTDEEDRAPRFSAGLAGLQDRLLQADDDLRRRRNHGPDRRLELQSR